MLCGCGGPGDRAAAQADEPPASSPAEDKGKLKATGSNPRGSSLAESKQKSPGPPTTEQLTIGSPVEPAKKRIVLRSGTEEVVVEQSRTEELELEVTDIRPGEVHLAGRFGARFVQGWVADAEVRLLTSSPPRDKTTTGSADAIASAGERFKARDTWTRARRKAAKSERMQAMLRELDNAVMMSNAYAEASTPRLSHDHLDDDEPTAADILRENIRPQEQDLRAGLGSAYDEALNREAWKLLNPEERLLVAKTDLIPAADLERLSRLVPLFSGQSQPTWTNAIGMTLVSIPAGNFHMGSDRGRPVRITRSFLIGQHEVTQQQYQTIMGENPSEYTAGGKMEFVVHGIDTSSFPVDSITWYDAVAFCRRLSEHPEEKAAGRTYRLPTEAEWEYACRAGTQADFHFGDLRDLSGTEANWDNSHLNLQPLGRPAAVGSYEPNAFGLYDMHGNAMEWCGDWFDKDYPSRMPSENPPGPELESIAAIGTYGLKVEYGPQLPERAVRGGAFNSHVVYKGELWTSMSYYRNGWRPDWRMAGFRVVCESNPASELALEQFQTLADFEQRRDPIRVQLKKFVQRIDDELTALAENLQQAPAASRAGLRHRRGKLLLKQGEVWEQIGDKQQSEASYRAAAAELKAGYGGPDLASAHEKLGDYAQAVTVWTQHLSNQPQFTLAYKYRGKAHLELEEYQQAISDLTQYMEAEEAMYRRYQHRNGFSRNSQLDHVREMRDMRALRIRAYEALGQNGAAESDRQFLKQAFP